jgi:hypothetical protein
MTLSAGARRSALGRPLDIHYPTNKAVIILLPIAGVIGVGLSVYHGIGVSSALWAGAGTAAAAFSGWALARELAPDDEYPAFISMALATMAYLAVDHASALLPILAMMLARMVARTVGPQPTLIDSVAVLIGGSVIAYSAHSAILALVVTIAFGLDAALAPRLSRQWIFAGLSSVAVILIALSAEGSPPAVPDRMHLLLGGVAGAYVAVLLATRTVRAHADLTDEPLSLSRVRAGMLLGLLVAMTGLFAGNHPLERSTVLWAVLLGVTIGRGVHLMRSTPSYSSR